MIRFVRSEPGSHVDVKGDARGRLERSGDAQDPLDLGLHVSYVGGMF